MTTTQPAVLDYKLLLKSLPGLYLILSSDFTIVEASDAYLQATLTKRENLIGRNVFEAFPENPETRTEHGAANLRQSLEHVVMVGTPHNMPIQRYDIPRPQNLGGTFEERYWMVSNHPIKNEAGELAYIVQHAIDVTMQQLAQHEIKMHRERFELLAQATSDAIWDWDLLHNHLWWNKGFQRTFGFKENSAIFDIDFWKEHLHPEDQDRVLNSLNRMIEHGEGLWIETYRFCRENGTYASVLDRGYVLRDEGGIAYRMVGSLVDISEQLQTETLSALSNDHLRQLLDALPYPAWATQPGSEPGRSGTYLNEAWYAYTGLPHGLAGGEQVIHPDDLERVTSMWRQSKTGNRPFEQELRIKDLQAGAYRWFLARAVPVSDEAGNATLWLGTCTDIDEQKKLQEALESKDRYWERILNEARLHFVVLKGPRHVCEFMTPALQKLLGNPETVGKPLLHTWPAAAHDFLEVLDTVYQTGKPWHGHEAQFVASVPNPASPGHTRLVFSCQPLHTESGSIEGIVAVATEVNGQVKME